MFDQQNVFIFHFFLHFFTFFDHFFWILGPTEFRARQFGGAIASPNYLALNSV